MVNVNELAGRTDEIISSRMFNIWESMFIFVCTCATTFTFYFVAVVLWKLHKRRG